jgi:hypothetical protein
MHSHANGKLALIKRLIKLFYRLYDVQRRVTGEISCSRIWMRRCPYGQN